MAIICPRCHSDNKENSRFCSNCATPLGKAGAEQASLTKTLPTPLSIISKGSLIADKYKIIDEVGAGGMGVVYKAEDLKLKRMVALKFLPPHLMGSSELKERFLVEAQAAAALSHPNICVIHEVGESEEQPYIAMEYVEGETLRDKIKKGPLKPEEALGIVTHVAAGLGEAHSKGIIHRDIKSANIMVTDRGQAKVMDFGLAKLRGGSSLTKSQTTLGTVAYMSPEQARGDELDQRTDLWSLGVVLYEMLTGELPFRGDRDLSIIHSIIHEEPKPLKQQKPPVPEALQQVVARALRKNRDSRYGSAGDMLRDLRKFEEALKAEAAGVFNLRSLFKRLRRPAVAIPTVLVAIAIAFSAVWFFNRQAKIRWARDSALPEIKLLIDSGEINYVEAYVLALKAERYIPKDPMLIESLSRCGMKVSVETEPSGAKVFMQDYRYPETDWNYLGVSPIKEVRVPFGFFRWKFEKAGYEPALAVQATFDWEMDKPSLNVPARIFRALDKEGTVPAGMVRVTGGELGGFFMDEHEVTNRDFKEFIDRGGYQKGEYWRYPFIRDGKNLTWEEAMAGFVDSTGMPGPSTWRGGRYPEEKDDFPVSGVSWYEAAAYAEFAGKILPTVKQWEMGAGLNIGTICAGGFFLPLLTSQSRFGGDGPASVKSHQGITTYGSFDMAGNVREWCRDETEKGMTLRGGAWDDAAYMFLHVSQAPPFDRSFKNGFRCVQGLDSGKIPEPAYQKIEYQEMRNYYEEKPVPEAIFQVYKEQFSYDKTELESRQEARDENQKDWIKEKISFNTAYENERMSIYLFLPKNVPPPYQTVIVFPGSQGVFLGSSEDFETSEYFRWIEFLVRSGRALIYPIYKGTYERGNSAVYFPMHLGNGTRQYSDFLIKVIMDFKRSIDYLETRDDIDIQKIVYYGFSWGAMFGAIIPAVEERLKVSVLYSGGFPAPNLRPEKVRPEVDEINYVTRVKIPTLMLNGLYDYHAFPLETSAKPMFDLLGTPAEDKRQIFYDSDHSLPASEHIRDTLSWLDHYLGSVKR